MTLRSTALGQRVSTSVYRQIALLSTWPLGRSPWVESLLLHRSVATGEVFFGQSDIDLLMVVGSEAVESGPNLGRLLQVVQKIQRLNPALSHIEVYPPGGIQEVARRDTMWGSLERRSARLLRGRPPEFPEIAVSRSHAIARFLLWIELHFASALQQRNARNLKKLSLECWDNFAVARGMLEEPTLRRSDMEIHLRRCRPDIDPDGLKDPATAVQFVLSLGAILHQAHLPSLQPMSQVTSLGVTTAPVILPRTLVVLPSPHTPLVPEVFTPGAYVCTPEILHLNLHFKNPFLSWALPSSITDLGFQPPSRSTWIRACHHYNQLRFLLFPGFTDPRVPVQGKRLACVRSALAQLREGQIPTALPPGEGEIPGTGAPTIRHYYDHLYDALREESRQIQKEVDELMASTGH